MKRARPFRKILGDHARVTKLSKRKARTMFRTKREVIQRTSVVRTPKGYSIAMNLANLLFPRNFPKIFCTSLKKPSELHASTTYSHRKRLTPESEKAINAYYQADITIGYAPYIEKYKHRINKMDDKIFEQTGIQVNPMFMNVGRTKRSFVFFEVESINVEKLRSFIENLPTNTPKQALIKRQAQELFLELEKMEREPGGQTIKVH